MLNVPCPDCNGDGFVSFGDRHVENRKESCLKCGGRGTVPARTGEVPQASADPFGARLYAAESVQPSRPSGETGGERLSQQDWFKLEWVASEMRRLGNEQSADAVMKAARIADEDAFQHKLVQSRETEGSKEAQRANLNEAFWLDARAEIAELSSRILQLEDGIRPFAAIFADGEPVGPIPRGLLDSKLTRADLRRATALLTTAPATDAGLGAKLPAVKALMVLVEELCDSVDASGEDVGGCRGSLTILGEIGPAFMLAQKEIA